VAALFLPTVAGIVFGALFLRRDNHFRPAAFDTPGFV
jgi:hypothetical protein